MCPLQHKFNNFWISSCLITHRNRLEIYANFLKIGKSTTPRLRISFTFHKTVAYDTYFYSFTQLFTGTRSIQA